MPRLPSKDEAARRDAYAQLLTSAPPQSQWEARGAAAHGASYGGGTSRPDAAPRRAFAAQVGGNTNFAIAAARLGLRVTCLGHTAPDVYGRFMADVLADERVALQQLLGARRGAGCAHATR